MENTSEFKKYQHVERFGTPQVRDIEKGKCYIFPKIDGTNSSLWIDKNNKLCGGSRKRLLNTIEKSGDNAGFFEWAKRQECFMLFFKRHPELRLFGEWAVPHTIKDYIDTAWRNLYVFDVVDLEGNHLHYDKYSPMLEACGIEYLKPLAILNTPTIEQLMDIADNNKFLMKDGCIGEGIVIKRYDYVNKYGRVTWAKIVHAEFHAKKDRRGNNKKNNPTCVTLVEEKIVDRYITEALVRKELAKIVNEVGEFEMKMTNRLLNMVFYSLITEDTWSFLKDFKNPSIDFKTLNYACSSKTKSFLPEYFNI